MTLRAEWWLYFKGRNFHRKKFWRLRKRQNVRNWFLRIRKNWKFYRKKLYYSTAQTVHFMERNSNEFDFFMGFPSCYFMYLITAWILDMKSLCKIIFSVIKICKSLVKDTLAGINSSEFSILKSSRTKITKIHVSLHESLFWLKFLSSKYCKAPLTQGRISLNLVWNPSCILFTNGSNKSKYDWKQTRLFKAIP